MGSTTTAVRLLEPFAVRGGVELRNRVVMAPMTRARSSEPDGVPSPLAPLYYGQRASAGLIVTEATNISLDAKGYSQTPGMYTDAQQERWQEVASAVHRRGGTIFMQLWHVGRLSATEVAGVPPVAPSPQTAQATVWVRRADGWSGQVPCDPARQADLADIKRIVGDFAAASRRAIDAGFDGVELHGANGYLIDQFLRTSTNRRTDGYGGDVHGRMRFLQEVVEAVATEVGPGRVGLRLSPVVVFPDAQDPAIEDTTLEVARWVDAARLGYLHLAEADGDWSGPGLSEGFRTALREAFTGPLIVAHDYDAARAESMLASGLADLIAFGRPYVANPDLVERMTHGHPLAQGNPHTYYGGQAVGYTDYPEWSPSS